MVNDQDLLTPMINNWSGFIDGAKQTIGIEILKGLQKTFMDQGQSTTETTIAWKPLSPLTKKLKGSSSILIETLQLFRTAGYRIEDCYYTTDKDVVKVGWFEDSGSYDREDEFGNIIHTISTPHVAAIHEFGMTGLRHTTPDGKQMGGDKIKGFIEIPERSMLRKTADIFASALSELMDKIFIEYININK